VTILDLKFEKSVAHRFAILRGPTFIFSNSDSTKIYLLYIVLYTSEKVDFLQTYVDGKIIKNWRAILNEKACSN